MLADRVKETTTTTGTGNITLAGAVTGFRTFNSTIGVGPDTYYCIVGATGEWEIGEGYLSNSTTLVRSVISSSNSNALVSFSAGTKDVFVCFPAYEMHTRGQILARCSGLTMN